MGKCQRARLVKNTDYPEESKVVWIKARLELKPFFEINLECHATDIAGDPEGHWLVKCNGPHTWWISYALR